MISKMIGGGRIENVRISLGRKGKIYVKARTGLYGTGIGVIIEKGDWQGMILVPRWESIRKLVKTTREVPKIKWTPSEIHRQKFPSIYYAIRETYHILVENYGVDLKVGEKALMLSAIEAAQNLNLAVIGLRKGNEEIYRVQLNKLVNQIERKIGHTFYNLFKQEGINYLEKLRTTRDSLGKVSETVKMVGALAAKKRFTGRLEEIMCIQPVIEERRKALLALRDLIEYRLAKTKHFLWTIRERLNLKTFISDKTEKERIVTHLLQLANEISQIDIQPYLFTCQMIGKELREAVRNIQNQEIDEALILLNRSLESLKLKDVQKKIEELIEKITVFLFRKKITEPDKLILEEVREIIRNLGRISEEEFEIKTKEMTIRELELALSYLKTYSLDGFDLAREDLKNASDYLMALKT